MPNLVRALLEKMGFDLALGPYMIRKNIRHPALRGDLSDWVARGTWRRPNAVLKDGGAGPFLFEHVVNAS